MGDQDCLVKSILQNMLTNLTQLRMNFHYWVNYFQLRTTQMTQKRILLTCSKSTEKQLRYLWCFCRPMGETAGGSVDVLRSFLSTLQKYLSVIWTVLYILYFYYLTPTQTSFVKCFAWKRSICAVSLKEMPLGVTLCYLTHWPYIHKWFVWFFSLCFSMFLTS